MVKAKDDYDKRMDDSRFAKFDKVLDPTYGQKQFNILIIGLLFIGSLIFVTTAVNYIGISSQNVTNTTLYEEGLIMSYSPEEKLFHISFTNPHNDTTSLSALIKIPFDSQSPTNPYLSVYDYSTSTFPVNITYAPAAKVLNVNYISIVTLVKETGNYTYTYIVIPDTENKMWQGTGKYLDQITKVLNTS